MKRVVVIGGGIAGLAAAYRLKQIGDKSSNFIEVRILEREKRLGGTIRTVYDEDGYIIEAGPDCFLAEKPWAISLAREMGIADRIEGTNDANKGTYILSNGKLHPLPDGVMLMVPTRIMPMVTSSLLSLFGKIRMGMDLFIPRKKDDIEETLSDFVTRRLGREALEKIAEPLVAGVHAGIPETMSLRASFPRFKQIEDEYGSLIKGMIARMRQAEKMKRDAKDSLTMFATFHKGLGDFIKEIAYRLDKEDILIGHSVIEVLRKDRGGWIIRVVDAPIMEADAVIFATPSHVTADLIHDLAPELHEELHDIPYVSTVTVSMAFEASTLPNTMKGFGFVVPRTEKRNIMAATWTSRKFFNRAPEGKALIRCFLGGAQHPDMIHQDEEWLIKASLSDLRAIVGLKADPIKSWVFRWPYSMPQTVVGHEARIKRIEERLAKYPGLEIAGGAYNGLGIPDCINSGQLAAERVIKSLFGDQTKQGN